MTVPAWIVQATAEAAPELVAEQIDRLRLVLAKDRQHAAPESAPTAPERRAA
ncbi:hypothetical protein [Micromonospora sp. CA-248212]|uniref:hypothetical protein n=1 Tax=Micromonospora sp. CA-248212 TaxID=3239961 RepID=UPI003D908F82